MHVKIERWLPSYSRNSPCVREWWHYILRERSHATTRWAAAHLGWLVLNFREAVVELSAAGCHMQSLLERLAEGAIIPVRPSSPIISSTVVASVLHLTRLSQSEPCAYRHICR